MPASIQVKLLLWSLVILAGLYAVFGWILYQRLETIVIGSIDDHLHSEVHFIAATLEVEEGEVEAALGEAAVGEYTVPGSGHYFQVVDAAGRIQVQSPSLRALKRHLPLPQGPRWVGVFETVTGPTGMPLRMYTQSFPLPGGSWVSVQASEPLTDALQVLASYQRWLWILFPGALVVTLLGVAWITRTSLSSIREVSARIARITERHLDERLDPEAVDRELRPLTRAFNTMLSRLEAAFQQQRQFFSDVSHELRTPISVIKSTCEVLLARERTPREYREGLLRVQAQADRTARLIQRILSLARMESPAALLHPTKLDLQRVLQEVIRALEPEAQAREIQLGLEGAPVSLEADRERLLEAFTNLVENAIRYNRPGGRVRIHWTARDQGVWIEIEDTGVGIPEEEQVRVFERFYRGERTRGAVEGSGLGLPIARAIVEAHGGRITLESQVGKGTRVRVWLPPSAREPL